ncbi:Dam family site-specific DNA-(adenine-N6)-methyltransferase [Kosakonia sp.]|uniref:Dam family site-specific DNA-(adenine-N6)-methyltransferase n=1 Tax=Kosakonia sp. TaxID=1916651 RepID=UPI0028AAFE40|nr:Dam family site-specific DNA-(adenine-N6)-methyltransferase [Kosakonia sp.]
MRYGSVCSGIEAATVAWEPLGWKAAWFAEIEKFPSAVLAERWPDVANLGDMTKIAAAVRAGTVEAPDILVGGTPCQAFSIAGLRNGLDDARGQLTLSYVELADAIDDKRREAGEEEAIIVWENVPGVLSSKDNAFGCFIAGLAGEDSELQPAGGKWANAGCVFGPSRVVAWRVLDAQFFGLAQRRRRVFVVASSRKGFDPAEVLFELDSVRRDTPPCRESQSAVAADAGKRTESGSHWDNPANPHPTLNQSNNDGGIGASNQEIFSQRGSGLVSNAYSDVSRTLLAKENDSTAEDLETYVVHGTQDPDINKELAHTIGRNHGQENACITFSYKDHGADATIDLSPTIRAGNHDTSHANSGQPPAVVHALSVRRLTPRECERLQGFPDDHTLIAWRGKDAADCPDGPRYKAIGNSMAVPVMRWIGERIAAALPVAEPTPRIYQRPFLKWAGGKYSLLPELDRLIPVGKRLIEPFVGGGSVFLNSDKHESFLLADVNADLINLYQMLTVVPELVTEWAKGLYEKLNDLDGFIACREEFNEQKMSGPEQAAAFLYLNRHCFNGLIRYNREGRFNVGYGKYRAPYFPAAEINAFVSMSRRCVFMNAGYIRTLSLASDGDVVYCDPPYEPMPGTAGFTNYAAGGFTWDDQQELARCCVAAHQRGARVVISNSTAPRIIELYKGHGFDLHHVSARRAISSKGSTRETATDIVAIL